MAAAVQQLLDEDINSAVSRCAIYPRFRLKFREVCLHCLASIVLCFKMWKRKKRGQQHSMESLEEVADREEAERQQSLRDLEQLYEWLQQFEDPPPAPRPPPPQQFRNGWFCSCFAQTTLFGYWPRFLNSGYINLYAASFISGVFHCFLSVLCKECIVNCW